MDGLIVLIAVVFPIATLIVSRFYFGNTINIKESGIQITICLLLVSLVWFLGRYSGALDYELWNGEVTAKNVERRDCPWGWRDYQDSFCTEYQTRRVKDGPARKVCTGSGKDKTCQTVQDYKTQYRYYFPWEQKFYVKTNMDYSYMVPRVDRQGAITPPNYTKRYIGEPASTTKSYNNWLKAASSNVFHQDGASEEKYKDILPKYPITIYDDIVANRIVKVGNVQVHEALNDSLRDILKDLGPKRQMNVVIVISDAKIVTQDFPYAVRRYWQGFKKNDAVVFIGLDGKIVKWVDVMSWSKKSLFDVALREKLNILRDKEILWPHIISSIYTEGMANYERREMKEFEYLKSEIPVPGWVLFMVLLFGVGGSIGMTYLFHRVEI